MKDNRLQTLKEYMKELKTKYRYVCKDCSKSTTECVDCNVSSYIDELEYMTNVLSNTKSDTKQEGD